MKITVFGASGGIGRHVVELSLAAGHEVRAYVRDPTKVGIASPRATLLAGSLGDTAKITEAVRGADAVISTLGWVAPATPAELTAGVQRILSAMEQQEVKRVILSSGAATLVDGDGSGSLKFRLFRSVTGLMVPKLIEQKQLEYEVVKATSLDWTIARPPALVNGRERGFRTAMEAPPSLTISRRDVAQFLVAQVSDRSWIRQAPFVAW